MNWFGKLMTGSKDSSNAGLPEIYAMSVKVGDFVKADVLATYRRILTDTAERTHGLKDEQWPLLWDSCVQTDSSHGLVTLLSEAMTNKDDLFVVYKPSLKVLRKADRSEEQQILADYKAHGESKAGVWISFKDYRRTDLLRVYSQIEYCVMSSLYKSVNLARAVQVKINGIRASVGLTDSSVAVEQAKSIAEALRDGDDVMLDAGDDITTAKVDIDPAKEAIAFLDAKRAFHLSLPLAYISGLQTGGIGSTGDADARAVDRGLKQYFASIMQPVVERVFGEDVEYRPEDTRQVESGLEVIKGLELVSDDLLSRETKRLLVARSFDVDPAKEQKSIEREAAERGSDTTLNGAQVAAMSAFLEQIAAGSLAPETAIKALMVSFNLSEDDAEAIVQPMQGFRAAGVDA